LSAGGGKAGTEARREKGFNPRRQFSRLLMIATRKHGVTLQSTDEAFGNGQNRKGIISPEFNNNTKSAC
jgi:hypothetical protein